MGLLKRICELKSSETRALHYPKYYKHLEWKAFYIDYVFKHADVLFNRWIHFQMKGFYPTKSTHTTPMIKTNKVWNTGKSIKLKLNCKYYWDIEILLRRNDTVNAISVHEMWRKLSNQPIMIVCFMLRVLKIIHLRYQSKSTMEEAIVNWVHSYSLII